MKLSLGLWHRNKRFHQGELRSVNQRQGIAKCLMYGAEHKLPISITFGDGKNFRARLKMSNRFHRTCKRCGKFQVNSRPLTHIKLSLREKVERSRPRQEFNSSRFLPLKKTLRRPRGPLLLMKRESIANGSKLNQSRKHVSSICERKQCVSFSPDHQSLHGRRKDRSENCRNSSYCGPSVPIHSAFFTKPPALTHSVQHAHTAAPLWFASHFAMRPERTKKVLGTDPARYSGEGTQ